MSHKKIANQKFEESFKRKHPAEWAAIVEFIELGRRPTLTDLNLLANGTDLKASSIYTTFSRLRAARRENDASKATETTTPKSRYSDSEIIVGKYREDVKKFHETHKKVWRHLQWMLSRNTTPKLIEYEKMAEAAKLKPSSIKLVFRKMRIIKKSENGGEEEEPNSEEDDEEEDYTDDVIFKNPNELRFDMKTDGCLSTPVDAKRGEYNVTPHPKIHMKRSRHQEDPCLATPPKRARLNLFLIFQNLQTTLQTLHGALSQLGVQEMAQMSSAMSTDLSGVKELTRDISASRGASEPLENVFLVFEQIKTSLETIDGSLSKIEEQDVEEMSSAMKFDLSKIKRMIGSGFEREEVEEQRVENVEKKAEPVNRLVKQEHVEEPVEEQPGQPVEQQE